MLTRPGYDTNLRYRFTSQWRAVFRVKSFMTFKAAVIRRKWLGEKGGCEGEVVVGDCRLLVEEPRRRDVDILGLGGGGGRGAGLSLRSL